MAQAFKVSAYSSTAQWIAGIFALIPALSPLSIVGIYGLYLLYLGLPMLMKAPAAKATSYTITVIVAVMRSFQTAFPDSNTPAHYRWSRALKENTTPEDDPASLERLENWRAAAAAPRRELS